MPDHAPTPPGPRWPAAYPSSPQIPLDPPKRTSIVYPGAEPPQPGWCTSMHRVSPPPVLVQMCFLYGMPAKAGGSTSPLCRLRLGFRIVRPVVFDGMLNIKVSQMRL